MLKLGKYYVLSVDKMCRNLAVVGNVTTKQERPRESTKKRGGGGESETPEMVLYHNIVAW